MKFFRWDNAKARSNLAKHGISFQTATEAFDDPYLVQEFDRFARDGREIRWHTIGMARGRLLLLIVHTTKDEDGDEYIRIISARKAEKREEETYYSTNRNRGCF